MKVLKRFWIAAVTAVLAYLFLGIYVDLGSLIATVGGLEATLFIKLIGLTSMGYVLRFLKWNYLLKNAGVRLCLKENAFVFLSGLSMTITPAKVGEIWRALLIKEISGERLSRTVPVVILDRISDVLSLSILSLLGLFYYKEGSLSILLIILLVVVLILTLKARNCINLLISMLKRRLKSYAENLQEFHQKISELVGLRIVSTSVTLGVFAWFFECAAMYFITLWFKAGLEVAAAFFVFSFASLAGAVSMVPGGLGTAEVTICGLLQYFGMEPAKAVGVSIIVRLATLWYGAFLGLAVYFAFRRSFLGGRKLKESCTSLNRARATFQV